MKLQNKNLIISTAVAGLISLAAQGGLFAADPKGASDAKGECHGVNSCKGTGECGAKAEGNVPGHSCAGKNSCKGKGWKSMTEADCKAEKGTFKKS